MAGHHKTWCHRSIVLFNLYKSSGKLTIVLLLTFVVFCACDDPVMDLLLCRFQGYAILD
ncbi:uncharacterized protein CC84DRAFT_833117 [Paraphaeosphaeria sporulosa]|uniref:Uncharacterized protein n=1 Tax=Paraphaeosphaeria sporulosa TaxID=1460663 RepID=A0A177CEA4_9PLEO|nr:uncharacterized protein CC84DRAFT_833117 [Paraphaeosphaeria sporulosa]OAG05242.1 hypothetical protein CC84DRAFT_833117 [Paraphaeosphaeria sporulosa]